MARCWPVRLADPNTYIYDPVADTWSAGPTKLYGDKHQGIWTQLPDGSILSYDVNGNPAGSPAARSLESRSTNDMGRCRQRARLAAKRIPQDMGPRCAAARWTRTPNSAPQQHRDLHVRRRPAMAPTEREAGPPVRSSPMDWKRWADVNGGSLGAAMLPNGHVLFVAAVPDSGRTDAVL